MCFHCLAQEKQETAIDTTHNKKPTGPTEDFH